MKRFLIIFFFFLNHKLILIKCPENWHNHYLNFDNIKNSMLFLFVVSTFDDWGIHLSIAKNANLNKIVKKYSNCLIIILFFFRDLKKIQVCTSLMYILPFLF